MVGKAIVKGNFEKAAMLFLAKPSAYEHPSSRQARRELQSTQDFDQALQNFPKQLRYERIMLRHLVEKPGDFVGAFRQLPFKLQELFVQAYQSYLFNRFLSERLKNGFSLNKAEVGDWLVSVERSGLPMVNMAKMVTAETRLTANESVQAGKTRIALPLIGAKHRLSQGAMGQIEKRILEEESVETQGFKVNAIPEIGRKGGLHTVVAPVKNFELHGISASAENRQEHRADLGFMLLRGSYATVLLREIIKPRSPIRAGF
jgi:tRNA pseudouridine13 synthase